jgi:hypothetical protein
LDKDLSPKEDATSPEPGGRRKSSGKRNALVLIGIAFGAAVLIGGGLLFAGGDESLEAPPVETVAECVTDGGYLALSNRTSALIREMGTSLNVASAIGTREAILGALEGLNTKYGPAFSLMAGEWRALDYCGDSKLASYNNALASELSSIGFAFTTLKADDNAALVEAAGNMNKITDISDDLAAYIGQQ